MLKMRSKSKVNRLSWLKLFIWCSFTIYLFRSNSSWTSFTLCSRWHNRSRIILLVPLINRLSGSPLNNQCKKDNWSVNSKPNWPFRAIIPSVNLFVKQSPQSQKLRPRKQNIQGKLLVPLCCQIKERNCCCRAYMSKWPSNKDWQKGKSPKQETK